MWQQMKKEKLTFGFNDNKKTYLHEYMRIFKKMYHIQNQCEVILLYINVTMKKSSSEYRHNTPANH